ncbi:polymorphic toxin-type HINT domain-containing protein [Lewinella sp. LCG006]|uniref:polymorphic toxin-type HINT domain-containing protein n=1 Tax=Lewinella sp. LCG006 TaxID=3231911 RepID=UPI003460139A
MTNTFAKSWQKMVRIVAGGDTITATNNHPFYLPQLGKYLRADSLRQNMKLLALTGALLTVHAVEAFDTTLQVYNFEVAEYHNYFVGEEGVLVHNDCALVKAGLVSNPDIHGSLTFDILADAFPELGSFELNIIKAELRNLLETASNKDELNAFFRADDLVGSIPAADIRTRRGIRVGAWEVLSEYSPIQIDDLTRSDGIFTPEEFSDILYYGTTQEAEDVLSFVDDISTFKKYKTNPEGNSILRNLIVDTEVDLSRQIIEVVNKVDGYKGLAANQLLSDFENFTTHLGQHTTLREWLYTSPNLYDDWYFPHRDMFELSDLGEQAIYCRQNNLGANYFHQRD